MPTKQTHSSNKKTASKSKPTAKAAAKPVVKAKAKTNHKEERHASERRVPETRRTDARPAHGERREEGHDRRDGHPAGAHATGPADFVITRKWTGKTLESHVGAHVRVELPESTLKGMSWQLAKLPHGVELAAANVEHLTKPEGQVNQNRIFDFNLTEAGEYLLQFSLQRPFDQRGVADTFKVKLQAN